MPEFLWEAGSGIAQRFLDQLFLAQWLAGVCLIGSAIARGLKPDLSFVNALGMAAISIVESAICTGPVVLVFGIVTLEGGFLLVTRPLGTAAGGAAWALLGAAILSGQACWSITSLHVDLGSRAIHRHWVLLSGIVYAKKIAM